MGNFLFGESGQKPAAFRSQGWQDQGNQLNDMLLAQARDAGSQQAPNLQFSSQYNPYQFTNSFNAKTAVQDAFTPQYNNLKRIAQEQEAQNLPSIQADLARRGLGNSGAAAWAVNQNRQNVQGNLSNQVAGLAGQQAGMNLQANQFGAQMDQNRQMQQAAELFRNRGASDQQAMMMAQYAMQRQQQPIQNLMGLYGLSAGATPGIEASGGLVGGAVQGFGQGAGQGLGMAAFCLPKGTEIETESGTTKVQDIQIGDEVKGGKVIAKQQILRKSGHKFFKHNFKNGSVVMSKGHPYFDEIESMEEVENDSECTYDILTSKGFYFVNGIKLGSTIKE